MSWALSVILGCILLAVLTGWMEYRRTNKSRLTWRILILLVAIIALACIALPITYTGTTPITGNNDAVLLTEHYNADSIKQSNYKIIYTLDKELKKSYPKAKLLSGVQDLNTIHPAIKQLHILGYGLDETDLQQINIPVVFSPQSLPDGIIAINWQQQLKTGDILQVQGRYNNTASKPIKLILKGLNTVLDSVNIEAGNISDFELTTIPKIAGRAAYTLLALNGKDTLEKESVPFLVEPSKPVKVLMLSSSPDFETKFLKNWLSENGYAVAARATISKDKISEDFVNMDKQPLDQLSVALFSKFDLVIGDLSTLKSLTQTESTALKQQVEQNGLGIITRIDSSGKATSWLHHNLRVSTLSAKTISAPLILQGQKNKTQPFNIDPTYITGHGNEQNLVSDAQNHLLATGNLSGEGKLIFTTLRNTYSWLLAGSNKDYSALWSLLINKAARKSPPIGGWSINDGIATINEPAVLQFQNGTLPTPISINNEIISPTQSSTTPYNWNINYWPSKIGWNQAVSSNAGASWLFVYQKSDWKGIKNLKKMADTKNYSYNRGIISSVSKQIQAKASIEVSKTFFYIILLLACIFLWVERKLSI